MNAKECGKNYRFSNSFKCKEELIGRKSYELRKMLEPLVFPVLCENVEVFPLKKSPVNVRSALKPVLEFSLSFTFTEFSWSSFLPLQVLCFCLFYICSFTR